MTEDSECGRLKITLLSGYLGAGKTTWLRHALHEKLFGRVHVFVQEAAQQPIDDLLLVNAKNITVLSGGDNSKLEACPLIDALLAFANKRSSVNSNERNIDRLVIETSGLVDPGEILNAIKKNPVLIHHFQLDQIISIADAQHALLSLQNDALCERQFLVADRIVISKADLVEEKTLMHLAVSLQQINPLARLTVSELGTERSMPDLPRFEGSVRFPAKNVTTDNMSVVSLLIPESISWVEFTIWLSAVLHARGDQVIRVKGILKTDAGRLLLQSVRKVMQQPEVMPPDGRRGDCCNTIVFIGRGLSESLLLSSLRRFLRK